MWMRGGVAVGLIWLASCAGRSHGDDDAPAAGTPGSGASGGSAQAGTGGEGGTKSGSAGSSSGDAGRGGSSAGTSASAGQGAAVGGAGVAGSTGGNAGVTGGGASAMGGMAGDAGAAPGGFGGSAGHELVPCNSSDGSGCPLDEVCLDDESDACWPAASANCTGYCAARLAPSTCDGISQCTGTVTCPALPAACPTGQVLSIVDECYGPCVPADCCACNNDRDCRLDDASCDIVAGRCVIPAAPEPRCLLPFEAGSCDGAIRVFAFVDGHCEEQTYGGCEGNDNRFSTLEECLRRCEGMPQQSECPQGRSPQLTCLACGLGGGCMQTATVCAKACETGEDCDQGLTCSQGWCGVNFCV